MWEDYPLEMTLLVVAIGEPEQAFYRYAAWNRGNRMRLCIYAPEGAHTDFNSWRVWISSQRCWETSTFAATLALVSEPRWQEQYLRR